MELTLWTYEGPPHVGAMRIAASMKGVHYVLHAPQGDTYADLLFTMIERRGKRPPVTYTTFQARDLGGDTAELVKRHIREAVERFKPDALLVGESCTAELIQDQPGALAGGMGFDLPIVSLELPAYSKKENWGASETLYQLVRGLLKNHGAAAEAHDPTRWKEAGRRPRVNLIGPSLLGFRCRDDVIEISRLLASHGIDVNTVVPLEATVADIMRLPEADLNVCLYAEIAESCCSWMERQFWDTLHANDAHRSGRYSRFPRRSPQPPWHGGTRCTRGRAKFQIALVFRIGGLHLPHRQTGVHFWRRQPCVGCGPSCQ